ncbi:MAG TPA: AsmA family protein [Granulicella sp.]|jgi:AsmA protein
MAEIQSTPDMEDHEPPRSRTRRRLVFFAAGVLVLLALVVTPPLLNVNRLRRRFATSMSQSLGRPVHLDNVTLHLLPIPGFTLQNLVVSEDPAFGYEPVIRANTVEATLRASSLWRRQVEFSSIQFIDPSLNIVRNAQGRWNLQEILVQAAHVNTAPTGQRRAGADPRFPYIEATGARVNLKIGEEKMPFSLTEADFALWLPSPQQWHVRLQGIPSRTDTNASDTGVIRLEGTLDRAAKFVDVPLNLTANWAHAQMGEASILVAGEDAGWRGTLDMGATLTGRLGSASLATDIHLTDLRRSDFVPAKPLDVSAHCTAMADAMIVTLTQAACTLPTSGPQPIVVSSSSLDLQRPDQSAAGIEVNAVPLAWGLDWVRLFSQRVPEDLQPEGKIDGHIQRGAGRADSTWVGDLRATLPPPASTESNTHPATLPVPTIFNARAPYPHDPASISLQLQPTVLHLGPGSQVTLAGEADTSGYALHLSGNASVTQLKALAKVLPPLGDSLDTVLPTAKAASDGLHEVSLSCSRSWGGTQRCGSSAADVPSKKVRAGKKR